MEDKTVKIKLWEQIVGYLTWDNRNKRSHFKFDKDIIKFNECDDIPSTLVEMAYYKMATSADIKMMNSKLIEVEGRKHFLTERFDRLNGEKLHVQTLAGISELADSYDDMFTIARRLHLSQAEKEQIFRQMVFNVLAQKR